MAGLGRKTFNSGDVLNAADVQGYLMDQAVMVFAGTAARGSAIPTPSAGMVAYSTATQLQVYDGSAWVDLSTGYGVATGGSSSSITVGGIAYTLLTFTTSSTLTVTKAGLFDVLCVGGGGSGGRRGSSNTGSGGGGGGAVIQQTIYLTTNATVTVGAKGATQSNSNVDGNIGTFSAVNQLAAGGGGGGMGSGDDPLRSAGSGGGGIGKVADGVNLAPGIPFITIGASTGGGGGFVTNTAGGGGGGSTQVGQDNSGNTAGNGGTGTDVSTFISGASLFHGAGGGGGSVSGTGGTAGNSTGGNGGSSSAAGSAATGTNYGCGGGGGLPSGGAGADGVVYVRFRV